MCSRSWEWGQERMTAQDNKEATDQPEKSPVLWLAKDSHWPWTEPTPARWQIKARSRENQPVLEWRGSRPWLGQGHSPALECRGGRPRLGPGEPVPCVSLLIPRCIPEHVSAAAAACDTHTLRSLSSMPFIFSMALSAASCVSKCTKA